MLKIIVVTSSATRRASGLFDAVKDLFINKAFSSCRVDVLSYEDEYAAEDVPKWKNVAVHLFKPYFFLYSKELKNALLASDADVYHQEGLWRYSHMLMSKWAKAKGRPVVCSTHGMLNKRIIKAQGRLKRILANLFFQKDLEAVSCFHVLCREEMENVRAYGLKSPIAIIPNGVYLPADDAHYEKPDSLKHILYLGRLDEIKGIDTALDAFGEIRKENPEQLRNWHFDIVGGGDKSYRNYLEVIVKNNGLEDFVTFHGALFGKDKERMYATCDAFLMASHYEALPMTVLEAWSWRKPVVMTPYCHFPEGYECGAAIEIDDNVAAIKAGLCRLLAMQDDELTEMGQKGRSLVEQNFTWDVSASKMIELYQWLLGQGEKPDFVYLLISVNEGGSSYLKLEPLSPASAITIEQERRAA